MRNQLSQRDDFYPQIVKLVIPIIIQNLLSAAVNSADVIMLNFVGQSSISAVSLAANYSNVLFMVYYGLGTGATLLCAQYYGKEITKPFRSSRESLFVFHDHLCSRGTRCIYHATDDDETVHQRSGASGHWFFLYPHYGYHLYLLGYDGGLSGCSSKHWTGDYQHGDEYAGLWTEYPFECDFYLRIVRSTQAWCYRCGYCYCTFQNDRADRLFYCFCFQQKCPTGSPMYVHKNKLLFSDFVRLSLPALGNDISWSIGFPCTL